jgi:hypothetical protein
LTKVPKKTVLTKSRSSQKFERREKLTQKLLECQLKPKAEQFAKLQLINEKIAKCQVIFVSVSHVFQI